MNPELLPRSGTWKIQSWIWIRNKWFRIHNTGLTNIAAVEGCQLMEGQAGGGHDDLGLPGLLAGPVHHHAELAHNVLKI